MTPREKSPEVEKANQMLQGAPKVEFPTISEMLMASKDSNNPQKGTRPEDLPSAAVKFDSKKVRTHLYPVRAYLMTCQTFDYGAVKYDVGNWKQGEGFHHSRLIDAAERHLAAIKLGELYDQESGLPHAAHAACCIAMLLECQLTGTGIDDLSKAQIHEQGQHLDGTFFVNRYYPPTAPKGEPK